MPVFSPLNCHPQLELFESCGGSRCLKPRLFVEHCYLFFKWLSLSALVDPYPYALHDWNNKTTNFDCSGDNFSERPVDVTSQTTSGTWWWNRACHLWNLWWREGRQLHQWFSAIPLTVSATTTYQKARVAHFPSIWDFKTAETLLLWSIFTSFLPQAMVGILRGEYFTRGCERRRLFWVWTW